MTNGPRTAAQHPAEARADPLTVAALALYSRADPRPERRAHPDSRYQQF